MMLESNRSYEQVWYYAPQSPSGKSVILPKPGSALEEGSDDTPMGVPRPSAKSDISFGPKNNSRI